MSTAIDVDKAKPKPEPNPKPIHDYTLFNM